MIQSEILREKERVQAMLAAESSSVHEYLLRARRAAEEAAACYGFTLRYADAADSLRQAAEGFSPQQHRPSECRP
jgi:hypothetical protein